MTKDLWLILFDCDGTLVDSQQLIVGAMQAAFQGAGQAAPSPKAIHQVIGLSLNQAIETLGIPTNDQLNHLIGEGYKASYTKLRDEQGEGEPLFHGAAELIGDLHLIEHYLLGVATGKSMKGVETLINRHKWHNLFHTIQTADNAPSKPHPGMIEAAMKETGVAPERAIMIGDTSFDMEMANNAGIKTIAVTWGYHSTEVLSAYQPDHMVEDMIALKAAISALTG